MIRLSRFVVGLITIICVVATVLSAFNGETILTSPYLITALLFNILQMQFECKLILSGRSQQNDG